MFRVEFPRIGIRDLARHAAAGINLLTRYRFNVRDRLITRRSRERQAALFVESDAGDHRANGVAASSEGAYVRSATHVAQEYWDKYDAAQVIPTTKLSH